VSTPRNAPLAMSADTFRVLGHQLVDDLAARLEAIPRGPVNHDESPSAVREALALNGPLPEQGTDPAALLESTTRLLFEHSLFNGHPRFFGYITSSPAPIGMLGDLLAAAVNPNVGGWTLSPAASEIEVQTVRWIAQLIAYPEDCGGVLVSGGNMANMVCFYAARVACADWKVREAGVASGSRLRVYASAETHWIPTDAEQRMQLPALRERIAADRAAGDLPMMVVGTGGSVSTGAVDPLPEIAALCREQRLWFHVDGAYGGIGVASPEAPEALRALSLADSVAVDPHKWLYSPLEAGCALVRDADALRAAFSYHPAYYHFAERTTNFVDYGPQNSRGFRALKVWLALRQVGASGYRRMISDDILLSRAMAEAVRAHPDLELATQELSITTFRYVPADLRARVRDETVEAHLDALNRQLLDTLQHGGELFVSNAVIRGRYVLRACIVNFHTSRADVEAVPEIVARHGAAIDRALRPEAL
jgi:aromatic-L-amino-acid decarboxylase